MQKDVIYIDVDDDITAIIGKVKAAKNKVVAIVPPKRTGALQSAVNLRLLNRAADQSSKKLVIISNNQALIHLAASAAIPIAKNLQSRPEIAQIPALDIDDGEDDVIDGSSLPVGELARTADRNPSSDDDDMSSVVSEIEKGDTSRQKATPKSKKSKVPNFDTFRKKLVLISVVSALLIGFLVWAIAFAPSAKVIISARTTDKAVSAQLTIGSTLSTDVKAKTIRSDMREQKTPVSIQFDATGKKEVGEKATGIVKMSISSIPLLGTTVPTGTVLTASNDKTYATNSPVTFTMSNWTGANVGVTATDRGASYNGATGSMTGAPAGVSVTIVDAITGGTDKTISVVTDEDAQKAIDKAKEGANSEEARGKLKQLFGNDYITLDATFVVDYADLKPSPAVDQEASTGKAILAGSVVYKMNAIAKKEASDYLDTYLKAEIGTDDNQKIYDNGLSAISFTNITLKDEIYTVNMSTNGKIGPEIKEDDVKAVAKGKRFGDVQASLQQINGVDTVDVQFAPFWVRQVPEDTNRIQVEFTINAT